MNKHLETDYHEIMLQPAVAELLPKLVYHMDEPGDRLRRFLAIWSRKPRGETLRVMLSGMGGDEVFAGYPRQLAMKIAGAFDPVPGMLATPINEDDRTFVTRWPAGSSDSTVAQRQEICPQCGTRL